MLEACLYILLGVWLGLFCTVGMRHNLRNRLTVAESALAVAMARLTVLTQRVNSKGGEAFLQDGIMPGVTLTEDDVKRLLSLCHPDKHGGKRLAQEMTQRLLAIREQQHTMH